jgi:hypothetical protein
MENGDRPAGWVADIEHAAGFALVALAAIEHEPRARLVHARSVSFRRSDGSSAAA